VTGKRSMVLVTVDCLRADHCGFHGYPRKTTPFLDSLARESLVVSNAFVAGAPTYYSLPAIHASRMPLSLGRDVVGLAPGEETMATCLRGCGYATAALAAANPYISPRFGYNQGFDEFRDFLDFDSRAEGPSPGIETGQAADKLASLTGHKAEAFRSLRGSVNQWLKGSARAIGLGRLYDELYFQYCARVAVRRGKDVPNLDALRRFPSADVLVQSAERWLASLDNRPFFLWLHFMDPHSPYYPTAAAYRELLGDDLLPTHARYLNAFWNRSDLSPSRLQRHRQDVIDLYDASIRWVDVQIARLVDFLRRSNRWDDCVLALTADHGEEFLEHGRRYHAPLSLVEQIAHVPMLLKMPKQTKAQNSTVLFSHLNLAPTLLEVLDVPRPRSFKGTSLLRQLQDDTVHDATPPVVAECVYGTNNPFQPETLLSFRLLAVRDSRYKLVIRLERGAVEDVYDLQSDQAEARPLPNSDMREVRQRLLEFAARYISEAAEARPSVARLQARLRDVRLELQER
jgi:arylsulfatase A-like enzyme